MVQCNMLLVNHKEMFKIALFLLVLLFSFCVSQKIYEFNRKTSGVIFSAYVKRSENGTIPEWDTYSLQDIVTMMKVISTRFTRVSTYGVGAKNVPYTPKDVYLTSHGQVFTAEAAAKVNAETGDKILSVLIGIWQSDKRQQMNTELEVALESARIAHSIYSGTVEGFVFSQGDIGTSVSRARETLTQIKLLKNNPVTKRLKSKIGTRQSCHIFTDIGNDEDADAEFLTLQRNIVMNSDFIICTVDPAEHNRNAGAKAGFSTVRDDLQEFRVEINKINPNIEVMGQTGWQSKGRQKWENLENMKDYWEIVDKWAAKNNFTMWLFEAFDNPWKSEFNSPSFGWWRLKENSLVNRMEGYSEKIYAPPEEDHDDHDQVTASNSKNPAMIAGITVGAILFVVVLVVVAFLYVRVQKLQKVLSREEVREFLYGMSEEAAGQHAASSNYATPSALQFPYDKSYEIAKEKLKIHKESMLGSGQFGCVYRALIEDDEKIEVALKMAKHNCPKSALMGLLSEIKILTYLGKHPNIVSIQGAYTAELSKGIVYVATELCNLGSLEDYLRDSQANLMGARYSNTPGEASTYINVEDLSRSTRMTFREVLRWSHEIACGMEYLGVKNVVHADLATRNVLLSSDKTAKITDFGLSRRLYDYTNYVKKQQEPLPWRWMAIESLKRLEFSNMSDVWSYGVTVWEIFSLGDIPYPGLSWTLEFVENLVNGLRMKSPPHATPEVYELMFSCWHTEPRQRPTFTDLKLTTADLMKSSLRKK